MKNTILLLLLAVSSVGVAQQNNELIVHEWGTFTARYTGLGKPYQDLHRIIDEKAPDFVYHVNFDTTIRTKRENKGEYYYEDGKLDLTDVSIKMETPVLYFYSKNGIADLDVAVNFPKGSISEFYPKPYRYEGPAHIDKIHRSLNENGTISFKNYKGFCSWKINVLPPNTNKHYTESDESVPNVWLAPRKTKANLIECNGEVEKYIFYRGLGGFVNSVVPNYTKSGDLIVRNTGGDITYALVFERDIDGQIYLWGKKSISENDSQVFRKDYNPVSESMWQNVYRKDFVMALVKAGLYEDEAEAMLNTWDASYFDKPGLKIFWIVPRSFTDQILPIQFSEPITDLQRVMIGRTEVDPFRTNDLPYYSDNWLNSSNSELKFRIYPNPASDVLFITSDIETSAVATFDIYNTTGQLVKSTDVELLPYTDSQINISDLAKSLYLIRIPGVAKVQKLIVE